MGFYFHVDWVSWLPQKMHTQITPKSYDHDHAEKKSYFCFIRLFMSEHDIWSSWSRLNQLQPPLDCAVFQNAMWPVKSNHSFYIFLGVLFWKQYDKRLMGAVKYGEYGCRIYRHFDTTQYCKLALDAKLHVVAKQMDFNYTPSSRQVLPTYLHPAVLKHIPIMFHLLSFQCDQTPRALSNACKGKKKVCLALLPLVVIRLLNV